MVHWIQYWKVNHSLPACYHILYFVTWVKIYLCVSKTMCLA